MRTPKPTAVSKLKSSILNTALTTHYECWFNPPSSILELIPDANRDLDYTLSCMEASLPGTSLATAELTNDHTGITERHVHRRQYDTTASFTFLVDRDYKQIKLFETWIGYIVNEQNSSQENYFYRVNFPKQYQTKIYINKFERDYKQPSLIYSFLNAYPISIDAIPVSYDGAQTLKCTVNFNFSRYVTGATTVKAASYPVLGDGDTSGAWVAGAGFNETGLVASTNKGAHESAFAAGDSRRAQIARQAVADIEEGRRGNAQ
jgi:hypothetical protein